MVQILITLALLLPLTGFVVLVAFGKRFAEPWPGIIATATVGTAFLLALIAAIDVLAGQRPRRDRHLVRVAARARRRGLVPVGPALGADDTGGHRGRVADPRLLDRVHARRRSLRAVLRLPEPVHLLDADAGARQQLRSDVRRVGTGRPLVVPADLVLVRAAHGCRGRQEGVRRQPDRRCRFPGRPDADLHHLRHPGVPRRVRERTRRTRHRAWPRSSR